jgi:hypothetical protein
VSKPDLSTILQNAENHVSANAHLPTLTDLLPQGLPPSHWSPTNPQEPNTTHSQAESHAGDGIVDHALDHAQSTLPDLTSLTGHEWFL